MSLPVTFELNGDDLRRLSGKISELADRVDALDDRSAPIEAKIRVPVFEKEDSRFDIEVGIDRLGIRWTCEF